MYISTLRNTPEVYKAVVEQIHHNNITTEQRIYSEVFAPTVLAFAEWTLQEAKKNGIQRLYFLARDGYQFYLAAQMICEQCQIPIECRYLKGSRYAWRVPEYHLNLAQAINKICIGGIHVTLYKMLKRAALSDEEIIQVAKELHMENELDRTLSYAETKALAPRFLECAKLQEYITQHSIEAYDTTIAYFRQEGLFEDVAYALVDSGWTGTLQITLENLLASAGKKKQIEGYYFGLYELPQGANQEQYHTYYFQPQGDIRRKAGFSNCLFESVFSAPEGMTLRYQMTSDGYIDAVSEMTRNPNAIRIEKNAEILQHIVHAVYPNGTFQNIQREQIENVLTQLMKHPSKDEAECLGGYWFSDDVQASSQQMVARDMTSREIENQHILNKILIMKGVKQGELVNSAWVEGSIVKCGVDIQKNLRHAYWYKLLIYIRKQL